MHESSQYATTPYQDLSTQNEKFQGSWYEHQPSSKKMVMKVVEELPFPSFPPTTLSVSKVREWVSKLLVCPNPLYKALIFGLNKECIVLGVP